MIFEVNMECGGKTPPSRSRGCALQSCGVVASHSKV